MIIGYARKTALAGIAALFLATEAAQASSDDLFRCGNQFFRVWTHSWPGHPPTSPRVTVSITRSDPDGDEWDGKEISDPRITRPIQKWLRTGRGRKCEHVKDFLWGKK
jgi:hypothetical protein